ncbi:MAG: Lar family restriction alleviation protein [Gammaproteobacteria bacterium]
MELQIKPCPACKNNMCVKQISALGEKGVRKWFYFLYCAQCGYGPTQAYDSSDKAIHYWNINGLSARRYYYPYWV